jgi:hypothetical protein
MKAPLFKRMAPMKISPHTINILRNFSQISQSITVEAGNFLSIKNDQVNSIQARVHVEEEFPRQFSLYDLNQFLMILSIDKNCHLSFAEDHLTVHMSSNQSVDYFYTDASLIQSLPKRELPNLQKVYSFPLTKEEWQTILKTASTLEATTLSVVGDGTEVVLRVKSKSSKHGFKINLPPSDVRFSAIMSMELFKMMPDDYTVSVCEAIGRAGSVVVFYFEGRGSSAGRTPSYLVATEENSRIHTND